VARKTPDEENDMTVAPSCSPSKNARSASGVGAAPRAVGGRSGASQPIDRSALLELPAVRRTKTIFCYLSHDHEVETHQLVRDWIAPENTSKRRLSTHSSSVISHVPSVILIGI